MGRPENSKLTIPMTRMNFLVTVGEDGGMAAFSEVTGVEAAVDVSEFRQGNSNSLAPIKIPGLVKHGNVTLKFGCSLDNKFIGWVAECISEMRKGDIIKDVTIELLDISKAAPKEVVETKQGTCIWTLKNAWVAKYSGPELSASSGEVAIESVELAYEELVMRGGAGAASPA